MSNEEHPGKRWQEAPAGRNMGADEQMELRLAAMAGHLQRDPVAARRAALVDLLADGRPHSRENIWKVVAAQLGDDCWGRRADETLWRDLQVLRDGGLRVDYSRRPGAEGYYLAYPPIARHAAFSRQAPDAAHAAAIRRMTVAQKNRQAFAAAAFALQQKRLILAQGNPEWSPRQVDDAARRLVYGRHEVT